MRVVQISKKDWEIFSENAHKAVFKEIKPASIDRIDFALVAEDDSELPMSYVTCRENDSETLYWQYGGSFPGTKGTVNSYAALLGFLRWTKERYKRVHFYVENTNLPMLKLAWRTGFLITGVRNYKGHILVENLLEFE